jgi:ankyrin repeat protein
MPESGPPSLPERPNLDQLRRQAKELRDAIRRGDAGASDRFAHHHPSAQAGDVSLAAAQLVVARELGFSSWPKLKAAVEADVASRRDVSAFVTASVEGLTKQARDILRSDPNIGRRSLLAATVLGDAEVVRDILGADPTAAVAIDDDRGWPPLLYACYSRWHQIDNNRMSGMAEVVRLLLDAGASPNTNDGGRLRYRSALRGSVEVNNPAITEVLLDAGANPDPGQPIGEAAGLRDHKCLELLLAHGARVAGTWAVDAAVHADDAVSTALLLDALAAGGGGAAGPATEALPEAAANASLPVVVALLDAGADPQATDSDGVSALRHAVRAGRNDTAAQLRALGATKDGSAADRFVGACLNADRHTAEEILVRHPDVRDRLTDDDRAVIVDAAASRPAGTVALLLEFGFSPHARNGLGEQPLHTAAYQGNAAVVRLLIDAGADVAARDARFDGTPLAFATVGSGEQAGKPGDWIETVRLLIDGGAPREDVWVLAKPPSEEVMELLRSYGITPEEPPEPQPDDEPQPDEQTEPPGTVGTGIMAELARHLEVAYRDNDLDLLGSLLHSEVHWTGVCNNSVQVLDWYRGLLADGTTATVESVEVDRDAVLLELTVARRAEGARPAPSQRVFQVFTVDGAQIVDIRAYPDRRRARTRTRDR